MMTNKLFSINRAVEYADLREDFEEHIFFSEGKVGYIIFSDSLASVTPAVADSYVAKGYHVGFLNDTTDAAHAYACPNNSFRAYLRGLATPVDNLQKMINTTAVQITSEIGLSGDLRDFGLHWFVNINRYMWIESQAGITGEIPQEICNLKKSFPHWDGRIYFNKLPGLTGNLPKNLHNLSLIKTLNISQNNLTGTIPRELGKMTWLQKLYLNNNNKIWGNIPVELGTMISLTSLHLESNNLTGYEKGAISIDQSLLIDITFVRQGGYNSTSGLSTMDVDQIILDTADMVRVNGQADGKLDISLNFPPSQLSITDAISRFGNISAKAFLESRGWTVTHS